MCDPRHAARPVQACAFMVEPCDLPAVVNFYASEALDRRLNGAKRQQKLRMKAVLALRKIGRLCRCSQDDADVPATRAPSAEVTAAA
jgi:hypothetical protein